MIINEREYWIGSRFVYEWDLVDDAGAPITTATVVGTVAKPAGGTPGSMTIDHETGSGTYRASYRPVQSGRHGWKLEATGQDVIEGEFTVNRDVTGAPPIVVDPAETVGMLRLLTTDLDEAFPILTDPQYEAFFALEGGNVKKGAAAALEAIATSETLRSKKITTQDLSIDGPAVAEDLRKRAKLLRDQVRKDIDDAKVDDDYANSFGFDSVDFDPNAGWYRSSGELAEWTP